MANLFENIVNLPGNIISGAGQGMSAVARGLFPGAAREADIRTQERLLGIRQAEESFKQKDLVLYLNIIKDQTGTWSPEAKQAAAQNIRKVFSGFSGINMLGKGALGGIQVPGDYMRSKIEQSPTGTTTTWEPTERFGTIPGQYQYVPREKRSELAQMDIVKPTTQVNLNQGQKISAQATLGNQWSSDTRVKDMRTGERYVSNVRSAYQEAAKSDSLKGPADIALAKAFQKLTDIASSVREGEFLTTFQGQPFWNKWRGKMQAYLSGGLGFTPEDRKAILDMSEAFEKDLQFYYNQAYDDMTVRAQVSELDLRAIIGNAQKYETDIDSQLAAIDARIAKLQGKKETESPKANLPPLPKINTEAPELQTITQKEIAPIFEKARKNKVNRLDIMNAVNSMKDLKLSKEEVLLAYNLLAEGLSVSEVKNRIKAKRKTTGK